MQIRKYAGADPGPLFEELSWAEEPYILIVDARPLSAYAVGVIATTLPGKIMQLSHSPCQALAVIVSGSLMHSIASHAKASVAAALNKKLKVDFPRSDAEAQ